MSRRRSLLGALVVLALALAIGAYAYYKDETAPTEKRGSAREEFVPTEDPTPAKPKGSTRPWPTYAYDRARRHVSPFDHRPPYSRIWKIDAHDTLEFPPAVGFGRVYIAQQKGLFFALSARTGRVKWRKKTKRCAASSPALGKKLVYVAYMDFVPCPQARRGARGFVIAWDAKTGKKRWRFNAAPVESSPLLVKRTLYFGSWDRRVYAVNARNGRKRWSFKADEEVNTSAAFWRGTIYIASDAGTLYALNARTGRLRWKAQSQAKFGSREFFYATPTVAYGRVFIGNTDGTMYVYGAKSGKLLWARPLGSYIYSAAAVWKRRVFVGTYSGTFFSLDAATGDVKWKKTAAASVHSAPTVMKGVVYYATCGSCGQEASRPVKMGRDGTAARDARTGRLLWRFRDGKYANPVVADRKRIYLTGRAQLYALEERGRARKRRKARGERRTAAKRKAARRKRERRR